MNAIDPGHARRSLQISTHLNRSGSPSAELMVTLIAPMLARVARRYESDPQRRGDLQQEMLIALWLSLGTLESSSAFQSWVNRVAHEVGMRHVTELRLSQRTERLRSELEPLPSTHDPEAIVANRERALSVLNLLDGLRRREREVVMLHLQELELDEMSKAMKICRTQVRETLHRARRRLMMRLRKADLRSTSQCVTQREKMTENESTPRHVPRGRRPTRSAHDRSNVYFIEPPATKMRPDGCA